MLGLGNETVKDSASLVEVFSNDYSLEFDGVNDFVEVDSVATNINKEVGTIACWVKIPTVSSTGFIFRAQEGSSGSTDNIIQMIYHASHNQLRISYKGTSSEGAITRTAQIVNGNTEIENQGWKHIVGTWDTGANEVKIYMDGSLVQTNSDAITVHDNDLDNADIGRNAGSQAAPFEGNIDELAIFNTVVAASDLYNGGAVKDLATYRAAGNLIAHWRFEKGTGTSAHDSSGNSHTGTINGAIYSTDTP